jgi:hypothetical protein
LHRELPGFPPSPTNIPRDSDDNEEGCEHHRRVEKKSCEGIIPGCGSIVIAFCPEARTTTPHRDSSQWQFKFDHDHGPDTV